MPANSVAARNGNKQDSPTEPSIQTNDLKICAPPLPPPPPLPKPKLSLQVTSHNKNNPSTPEHEVAAACKRFLGGKLDSSARVVVCYKPTQSILQDGPMCGLVALEMAAQHVCPKVIPTTADIYEAAKLLKYTLQGEMFSAENIAHLARQLLKCEATVISDGLTGKQEIVKALLMGTPVLVPYDADCNHEPCCKNGHKAHWAVLVGIAIVLGAQAPCALSAYQQDAHIANVYHVTPAADKNILLQMSEASDVYVLAKQGKSAHLGIWSFTALEASNANLVEMDPNRSQEEYQYVVPSGGIQQALCQKIVILNLTS